MLDPEDRRLLFGEDLEEGEIALNQPGAPPPQPDLENYNEDSDLNDFPINGPSQVQRSCQHEFMYHPGTVRCAVCTLGTEDVYADCLTCNVRTCLECSQDFLGNVELNWPVDEDV